MKNVILRNDSLEYKFVVNGSNVNNIILIQHILMLRSLGSNFVVLNIWLLLFFHQTCIFGTIGQSTNLCTLVSILWESSIGFYYTDFWFLGTRLILSVTLNSAELNREYKTTFFKIGIESLRNKYCVKSFEDFFSSFYWTFVYRYVIHMETECASSFMWPSVFLDKYVSVVSSILI